MLTAIAPEPFGYSRILRNELGQVTGIVEEKMPRRSSGKSRKSIRESTARKCLCCLNCWAICPTTTPQEYYLTDILDLCRKAGRTVAGIRTEDFDMVMGINSRRQLAQAQKVMNARLLDKLMDEGVTVMDPASTFVEKDVRVGRDSVLYPFTWLEGKRKSGRTVK